MTLITLEEAAQEFAESVAYYESREPGLGSRFRDEVAAVVDWILRFPEAPRLRRKGYRRVNLRTFPHYVAYIIRGDTLWVTAIAHGHRRPEFWIERV
ncbi:MAG: type II toxin-antitoxin system RelE/ParE family toxin [Verrucomicrobia bacterium]|nr:type II toxin-antitoxin system RelE/ParE family toxin [Verrucomicrobiota bacterium]